MACSLKLCPLSLPNRSPPPRLLRSRAELSTSSLLYSPPCRRQRRKNHLRPKLPNLAPPPPLPELVELSSNSTADNLLVAVGVEAEEKPFSAFEIANPSPEFAAHGWFPGPVLGLAARFAVLLAIQTAIAVCYLSMQDVQEAEEERRNNNQLGLVRKEKEMAVGKGKGMEGEEFERMILEIRAMAREARDREGKGCPYGSGVGKEVREDLGMKKKIISGIGMDGKEDEPSRKRNTRKLRASVAPRKNFRNVWYLSEAKGFGGSKKAKDGSGLDKGMDSTELHEYKKLVAKPSVVSIKSYIKDRTRVPEQLQDLTNMQISKITEMELPKLGSENPTTSKSIKVATSENLAKTKRNPSKESSKGKARSLVCSPPITPRNEAIASSPWWLKLPCVFGILLKGGCGDEGLYSLKTSPAGVDGGLPSCAVVFQDCIDAKKFRLLLGSFFEDLGDVCTKVVPLTMPEIEAICAAEQKFIVIRKGQLSLYAGQPLLEVENVLRSLVQ